MSVEWRAVLGAPGVCVAVQLRADGVGGVSRDQAEKVSCWVGGASLFFSIPKMSPTLLILGRDSAQLTVGKAPEVCAVQ